MNQNKRIPCYVQGMIDSCDFTDKVFHKFVKGVHIIAPSATGGWCPVMFMSCAEATRIGVKVYPAETVRQMILDQKNGEYPDF